ncbi:hypothetical protein CDL15_Pgr021077 [Punica granatum]|nr:hypothetical protein CDL15_Pgr021077 [Punica granatum]
MFGIAPAQADDFRNARGDDIDRFGIMRSRPRLLLVFPAWAGGQNKVVTVPESDDGLEEISIDVLSSQQGNIPYEHSDIATVDRA